MKHSLTSGDRWRLPLALAGLTGAAITQPIFQLLGEQASFFVAHRLDRFDLLVFVSFLSLGLPALLWLLASVPGLLGSRPRELGSKTLLGALTFLTVLVALRSFGDPFAAGGALALAVAAGLAAAWAWTRSRPLRGLLALSAVIVPVAAGLFAWPTAAAGLWVSPPRSPARPPPVPAPQAPAAQPTSPHPIVWVVFDELPLASLLDASGMIDAELYPNFAALAAGATWYRNASTVWSHTELSITSMLAGVVAEADHPPTRAHYPDNLLTWLGRSHTVSATELVTDLAGTRDSAAPDSAPTRRQRWSDLIQDVSLIYAHRVLPPALATGLPPVDSRWAHFGEESPAGAPDRLRRFALNDDRGRRYVRFLARIQPASPPPFYFEHVMLPHLPARFLPSRKVYAGRPIYGPPSTAWLEDEQYAIEVYRRHLTQVAFVDRLVGDLVSRMREVGLLDRTLLIITSDHGSSHWPGQDRRVPGATAHPDDILRVPLFIKAPGQTRGTVRDDNVQTIDLPATVADFLGVELPWSTAGLSARDPGTPRPAVKVLCDPKTGCMNLSAALAQDQATLRRKTALFDPARGEHRWTSQGAYRDLIGQPVSGLDEAPPAVCDATLDQLAPLRAHDPADSYAAAQWSGRLHCRRPLPAGASLALVSLGRLRATTTTREVDGATLFSVFVGDHVLEPGDNEPRLYLIEGGPESATLALVPFQESRS